MLFFCSLAAEKVNDFVCSNAVQPGAETGFLCIIACNRLKHGNKNILCQVHGGVLVGGLPVNIHVTIIKVFSYQFISGFPVASYLYLPYQLVFSVQRHTPFASPLTYIFVSSKQIVSIKVDFIFYIRQLHFLQILHYFTILLTFFEYTLSFSKWWN